jgi:hypothetical protein
MDVKRNSSVDKEIHRKSRQKNIDIDFSVPIRIQHAATVRPFPRLVDQLVEILNEVCSFLYLLVRTHIFGALCRGALPPGAPEAK